MAKRIRLVEFDYEHGDGAGHFSEKVSLTPAQERHVRKILRDGESAGYIANPYVGEEQKTATPYHRFVSTVVEAIFGFDSDYGAEG